MIIDVPKPADFQANGLAFLNLAWDSILSLSQDLKESAEILLKHKEVTTREQRRIEKKYWAEAQHALAIAVALAHQGGEFLLKARIAKVSPFLLLSVEKWPSTTADKSFADYKTVDAQDLVRIHDAVCRVKLSEAFKQRFEELRWLRNTVMHSVDKRTPFSARDGVLAILEISESLMGPSTWHKLRKDYLDNGINYTDPNYNSDFNPAFPFARETLHVLDEMLQPAEAKRFYDFDPKRRRYICFHCDEEYADDHIVSGQLRPNNPDAKSLYYICCMRTIAVRRVACPNKPCKGNVIGPDRWEDGSCCLTCGKSVEPDDD